MSAPPPRGSSAARPTTTPTSPGRYWRPAWPSARAAAMSANGTPTCRTAGSAPRPAGAASRPAAIYRTHRLTDLLVAPLGGHHDPAGLAPVLGLVPVAPGQAEAHPLGDHVGQDR